MASVLIYLQVIRIGCGTVFGGMITCNLRRITLIYHTEMTIFISGFRWRTYPDSTEPASREGSSPGVDHEADEEVVLGKWALVVSLVRVLSSVQIVVVDVLHVSGR